MDSNSFKISYMPTLRSTYLGKEKAYPSARVMEIVSAIDNNQTKHKVLSLISSYEGEGAPEIAFELASKLSSSGKRVLIVDTESTDLGVYTEFRYKIPKSINSLLQNLSISDYTVLQVEGSNIFYSCFYKGAAEKNTSYSSERFSSFFKSLRDIFDYVLLINEAGISLSIAYTMQISDASIVIVEAERTRRPVVAQLIENIKFCGGNIIGLVLNKRPLYIPQMIYSLFYK